MKINFAIISRILSIHYAFIMSKLKLPATICCVALCFLKKEQNSLKALIILTKLHCDDGLINILLYWSYKYSFCTNKKILSFTVEFLQSTKRFEKMLFWIVPTFHGHMKCSNIVKTSICCWHIMQTSFWHWDNVMHFIVYC